MRNLIKTTAVIASLAAVLALNAASARAEPSMDKGSTIQVDDGKGGWKPYTPKKPPAGPTGVSVDKGNGWQPFNPPPPPPPGFAGISVMDENGNWVPYAPAPKPPAMKPKKKTVPTLLKEYKVKNGNTYWLLQTPGGGQYIQIFDQNGNPVQGVEAMAFPGTAGPAIPVH